MFSPATKPVSPETSNVASGSVVVTSTVTSVVSGSNSIVSPSTASMPLTCNTERLVSVFKGTITETVKSSVVSWSAAVTVITMSFEPTDKSVSPNTS